MNKSKTGQLPIGNLSWEDSEYRCKAVVEDGYYVCESYEGLSLVKDRHISAQFWKKITDSNGAPKKNSKRKNRYPFYFTIIDWFSSLDEAKKACKDHFILQPKKP